MDGRHEDCVVEKAGVSGKGGGSAKVGVVEFFWRASSS